MKRCPNCNRTYADDNQKFCTHDGGRLLAEMAGTMTLDDYSPPPNPNFDPNATVRADLSELDMQPPAATPPHAPPPQPPPAQPPQRPAAPEVDLNATIAATPPPLTSDFRPPQTGPTGPPSYPGPSTPPAQQQPPAHPPQAATQTLDQRHTSASLQEPARTSTDLSAPPAPSTDLGATLAQPPEPAAPMPPPPVQHQPQPAPYQPQPPQPVYHQPQPVQHPQPGTAPQPPLGSGAAASSTGPASAPLPSTEPAASGPVQAKRKSKTGLVLGILGGLLVLLIAGGALLFFTVIKPRYLANANGNGNINTTNTGGSSNANANTNGNESANANQNTNTGGNSNMDAGLGIPPAAPPPGSEKFVNSSASLDGKLAEHYIDFSFFYPQGWRKDPRSGVAGASNFVKVERLKPPDYTQENFAVGWYSSSGTFEGDKDLFPKLVEVLNSSFARNAQSFPEYRKISEGETTVGLYKGYEFRFESIVRGTANGDVRQWGRVVFLPPTGTGEKNGVTLLMLATSLAPELTSAEDVGLKGELPVILDTFRFGKEQQ